MGTCCAKEKQSPEEERVEQELLAGKKPIFWIIGGPGSGKQTIGHLLYLKFGLFHISSGEVLEAEAESGSQLGKEIDTMIKRGYLIPRYIILDLLKAAMFEAYDYVNGYIISGFPRDVFLGKDFIDKIGPCTNLIYLKCCDDTMIVRSGRKRYLAGLENEDRDYLKNRIRVFRQAEARLIKAFRSILVTIDADRKQNVVFEECCELLKSLNVPVEDLSEEEEEDDYDDDSEEEEEEVDREPRPSEFFELYAHWEPTKEELGDTQEIDFILK